MNGLTLEGFKEAIKDIAGTDRVQVNEKYVTLTIGKHAGRDVNNVPKCEVLLEQDGKYYYIVKGQMSGYQSAWVLATAEPGFSNTRLTMVRRAKIYEYGNYQYKDVYDNYQFEENNDFTTSNDGGKHIYTRDFENLIVTRLGWSADAHTEPVMFGDDINMNLHFDLHVYEASVL